MFFAKPDGTPLAYLHQEPILITTYNWQAWVFNKMPTPWEERIRLLVSR